MNQTVRGPLHYSECMSALDLEHIQQLSELLAVKRPFAVLSGAGVSTDSGIPDYRGAGSPPRTPMNIAEFLGDHEFRQRFWAGASVNAKRGGWNVAPNMGHHALALLEQHGYINGVITQNVDGLHAAAGTHTVVELHGSGHHIRCTDCSTLFTRQEVISWFDRANPGYTDSQLTADVAPDGDAVVTNTEHLVVPVCPVCTGILRPEVVYFGETVPKPVFQAAEALVHESGGLLVVGSSLAVNTGIRLVRRAEAKELPLVIINRGPTAVDARADLRIDDGVSETLTAVLEELELTSED